MTAANDPSADSLPPDPLTLFGHEDYQKQAQDLLSAGRIPPVLVVHGRAGIGKKTLVSKIVAMANCEAKSGCGRCVPCLEWRGGVYSESLWLKPENGKHLQQTARDLAEHLAIQRGVGSRRRIGVIADCDLMTPGCANRLLKLLEEPPPDSLVVLITSQPDVLLPTIRSRTVAWEIKPPSLSASLSFLQTSFPDRSSDELKNLLLHYGRSPGLVVESLEQDHDGGASLAELVKPWLENILQGEKERSPSSQKLEEILAQSANAEPGHLWLVMEVALNQLYRNRLESNNSYDINILQTLRSRLRRLKQLTSRGRIALNTRLALEALPEDDGTLVAAGDGLWSM